MPPTTDSISYQAKAVEDYHHFRSHAHRILAQLGRPVDAIAEEEMHRFCKGSADIQVLYYRSLRQEYSIEVQRDKYGRLGEGTWCHAR
jgi:hypothetical protein